MKLVTSLLMMAVLTTSMVGCESKNKARFDQHRIDNLQSSKKLHRDPINAGIITQSTIYPHHFITHTPTLNSLGMKDLDVLADHYINDVMPVSSPVRIVSNIIVFFDYDKSNLRLESSSVLNAAIKALDENPDADILITGRTDIRGSDEYNLKLGDRRAKSVDAYMVAGGVDPSRIRIISRGEMDALAPEANEAGMQEDRNAHFVVADMRHYPIPLNVRQAGASDHLYQARRKNTLKYLADKGVDVSLIQLADDFAGGEGLASEQVFVIVTTDTSIGSEESSDFSRSSSDSGR